MSSSESRASRAVFFCQNSMWIWGRFGIILLGLGILCPQRLGSGRRWAQHSMDYFSSSLNGSAVASLLEHICSLRVGKAVVAMVLLQEVVSKRSMNFANQREAYVLRTVGKKSWTHIAGQVVNLQGNRPAWGSVRNVVTAFSVKRGRRHYKYARCGRKPWKMTPNVQQYVRRRLLADRTSKVVTSKTLQADVAREKGVLVADSCIRKLLLKRGYKWLPRRQKRNTALRRNGFALALHGPPSALVSEVSLGSLACRSTASS